MSRDFPWFKLYVNDFVAMCAGLTCSEVGILMQLYAMMFGRDGEIARDDKLLARRFKCTVPTLKKALSNLLQQELIIESDGVLTAIYVRDEIADRSARRKSASHAATQKAKARREKTQQNQSTIPAQAVRDECAHAATSESTNQNDDEEDASIVCFGAGETADRYRERILEAVGFNEIKRVTSFEARRLGSQENMIEARKWRDTLSLSEDQVIQEIRDTMIRKGGGPPSSLRYFSPSMSDLRQRIDAPLPEPNPDAKKSPQISKGSYHAASTLRSRNGSAYLALADQIRARDVNFRVENSS